MLRLRMFGCVLFVASLGLPVLNAQVPSVGGRWVPDASKNSEMHGGRTGSRDGVPNAAIIVRQLGSDIEIGLEAAETPSARIRNAKVRAVAEGQGFKERRESGAATPDVKWYLEGSSLVREQRIQLHGTANRRWITFKMYYRRG